MAKSTKSKRPSKPYPDFPLFPHATGRWAKKIRGKLHYFGPWADPQGALNRYLDERDDLYAGRTPQHKQGRLTIEETCNRFLHAKRGKVDSGELAESTWRDYQAVCKRVVAFFGRLRVVEGLRGDDFDRFRAKLAKTNGLVGLRNQITQTRMIFNYALKAGLIERPVKFGANFARPSAKAIRKQRTPRMFEAEEIRKLLDEAGPVLRAMILLGANCAFGPADVGRLPKSAVDLQAGWITFPRPKTGADRRIPLWPETVDALRNALKFRPKPADEANKDLVFVTRHGGSWFKDSTRYLTGKFSEFLRQVGLYQRGRGFYALRHVFETIGGESRDQVAVDAIMGRERGDMGSIYRERISDERLERVVAVVREWLFAEPEADEEAPAIVKFRRPR